ncbi:unnamed protein product [Brachionus calyciflorus]|uniref:ATPase inhibitor n=1 Tax=Brachionus calyciflorus TaxID=104777 RepID=A0A813WNB3_9BILA|nr:unnamed protein product [Brachionus calyciflorus]CAF1037319.1 unnamed protein product [Brachionus calyciflorus]
MESSSGYSSGKYGGSIRESGGVFGAREQANEELYFRKQDEIKLQELREKLEAQKNKEKHESEHQSQQKQS